MNYKHIFEPAALDEYTAAFQWCEARGRSAAINFVKEVKDKIKAVCLDTFSYQNTYKQNRKNS